MFRRFLRGRWLKNYLARKGRPADARFERDDVEFGPLLDSDLRAVWRIEKVSYPSPWPVSVFQDLMDDSLHGFEAGRVEGKLVCYAGYAAKGEIGHIINVCVHPDIRQRGLGALLLERLLERLVDEGFTKATLEVRERNLGAQLLYRKLGFKAYEQNQGYYFDTEEAAILMDRELIPKIIDEPVASRDTTHGTHISFR